MKKFVLAAAAVVGFGMMPGAASAASQLTVATYYNIPFYNYYPTSSTIDAEVAYTNSVTPDVTQVQALDPSYFSAGMGGYTAMNFSGSLIVDTDGYYDFHVDADDAARISIDGLAIVESNFYGGGLNLPNDSSIYLTAGTHAYDAFAFQEVGGQYFDTSVTGVGAATFSAAAPAAAVPEPATWAMFIGGFGLIGATTRRKKAAVSFV